MPPDEHRSWLWPASWTVQIGRQCCQRGGAAGGVRVRSASMSRGRTRRNRVTDHVVRERPDVTPPEEVGQVERRLTTVG